VLMVLLLLLLLLLTFVCDTPRGLCSGCAVH
jgi:hypothetical protein